MLIKLCILLIRLLLLRLFWNQTCITRFDRPVSFDNSSKTLGVGLGFWSKQVLSISNWWGLMVVFGPRFRLFLGSSMASLFRSCSSSELASLMSLFGRLSFLSDVSQLSSSKID